MGRQSIPRDLVDPALMGDLRQILAGSIEGRLTVTLAQLEGDLAHLDLVIDVTSTLKETDLSPVIKRIAEFVEDWPSFEVAHLRIEGDLKATGTALWDTRHGHLRSLALSGELESGMSLGLTWDYGTPETWIIDLLSEVTATFDQTVDVR